MIRPTHRTRQNPNPPRHTHPQAEVLSASFEALEPKVLLSTYYIATSGSDSAAGSLSSPFASLSKFFSIAKPGDTALIRGGTYSNWVNIEPNKSGTASAPITVSNYNNEQVIIDHKTPTSGTFMTFDNGESYINVHGLTVKDFLQGFNFQGGSNHITIDDMNMSSFDVPGSSASGRGVRLRGADYITISNSNIQDVGGVGIAAIGHVDNCTFSNLTIHNINDGAGTSGDADGINFTYADNTWADYVNINNVSVWDTTEDGIDIKADHVTETNDTVYDVGSVAFKAWSVNGGGVYENQGHFTFDNCYGFGGGEATFKAFSLPALTISNSKFYGGGSTEPTVYYKAAAGGETWNGSLDIQNTIMEHVGGNYALEANQTGDTHFNLQGNTYYSSGSKATDILTSGGSKTFTDAQMGDGTFYNSMGVESKGSGAKVNLPPAVFYANGTQPLAAGQTGNFSAMAVDPEGRLGQLQLGLRRRQHGQRGLRHARLFGRRHLQCQAHRDRQLRRRRHGYNVRGGRHGRTCDPAASRQHRAGCQ